MYNHVNPEKLKYCIKEWCETFNDCACCPLYPYECEGNNPNKEKCIKRIIRWIADIDEVVKPQ